VATYAQQLQDVVRQYQADHSVGTFQAKDVAAWAIMNGLWKEHPSAIVNRCAEDLSRAMREEYTVDAKGRRVRIKHAISVTRDGKQLTLWADLRTATRSHMVLAFQQRRHQVLGDCRQLKADMDSYNETHNPGGPIQLVFDFGLDLEESDLAA
jgi:hypothetical protein